MPQARHERDQNFQEVPNLKERGIFVSTKEIPRTSESSSPSDPIEVVAGLILYAGVDNQLQNHFLIARRKMTDSGGGFWEFPGGKVEAQENFHEALKREIQEELELSIEVQEIRRSKIDDTVVRSPTGKWIRLSLLVASATSSHFILNDHEEARWVRADDLDGLPFLEGNRRFFVAIRRLLGGQAD
jgi:8-oxo-dGTP diphosphatase